MGPGLVKVFSYNDFLKAAMAEYRGRFNARYTIFCFVILFLIFHLVSMSFLSRVQVVRTT